MGHTIMKGYTTASSWLMETHFLRLRMLAHLLVNTRLTFLAAFLWSQNK